jgi:hypothetical protein
MNPKIDALITAVLAYADANPVAPPQGVTDTPQEALDRAREAALSLAVVRLVKRYANQQAVDEIPLLISSLRRLSTRHTALDVVLNNARQATITANATAIAASVASANVAE